MFARAILAASLLIGATTLASAQEATQETCAAAIAALNNEITSKQGVPEGSRQNARDLSQQASDASNAGDYARCIQLTADGMQAMS